MSLDRQRALTELGLPEDIYDELLGIFAQQSEPALKSLKSALEAGNFEETAKLAHFVKGSAGNLRLEEMHLLAKELELGAKDHKEIGMLAALGEKLTAAFEDFKKNLPKK